MGLGLFRHYHVQALRVNENSQVQKWLLAMRGGLCFGMSAMEARVTHGSVARDG